MPHAIDVDPDYRGKRRWRGFDGAIARLAMRQHGVVTRRQLLDLGLGSRAVDHRLECGRLHSLYRGVYVFGTPEATKEGQWMAAVLAGGPGAVLSHRSAAALWDLAKGFPAPTEVTTPRDRRARRGIRFHRSSLPPDETTTHDGIPTTTVPRTIFDIAATASARQVERAINETEVLRLWDELSLHTLLDRYPGRAGTAAIRRAMAGRSAGASMTHSELEERFLTLVAKSNLPRPEVNAHIEGCEVDCAWREQKLAVELDGHATHQTALAFERDRERDRILTAAGWRVVRVTWHQLDRTPDAVTADLRRLLHG